MSRPALLSVVEQMISNMRSQRATKNEPPKEENKPLTHKFLNVVHKITKSEFFEALDSAAKLNKTVRFETFNPVHMEAAEQLINVLYKIESPYFEKAVNVAKAHVNSSLLNYVLCVVLRHRDDALTENIQVPSQVCTNPEMYFDMSIVDSELSSQQAEPTAKGAKPIFLDVKSDFTASDLDPEHRIAYFREDIGINLHHRHWHEVYPGMGAKEIIDKDRRGELFYYMHHQVIARYNFERLCNSLSRTKPFSDFHEPIPEVYYPKLDIDSKTKIWCPRQANATLKDLYRDGIQVKLTNLKHWRDRLYDAIDSGYARVRNEDGTITTKKLTEPEAINELGNSIESVQGLSWDPRYYGDIHNSGHLLISYCHDPDYRYREVGSVMSYSEAALRDPMFYRWHVFVDDIFQQYKLTLPPYTVQEREFKGIEISSVEVISNITNSKNLFNTFWQKDTVDISEGILNRNPEVNGSVYVTFSHLNHEDFTYNITVNNTNNVEKTGTFRVFYAPKYDESKVELTFNSQRKLFIELDKFTASLKVGSNTIQRKSTSSSVTIPFHQTFMTLNEARKYTQKKLEKTDLSYCGCGWPQHLLIGKGTEAGFECVLFVMITDYAIDQVEGGSLETECCEKSAISYCGLRDKKYPDKRPMGFPFDRNISDGKATIADFMKKLQKPSKNRASKVIQEDDALSNMRIIDVKVKFEEKTVDGPSIEKVKKVFSVGK